MQGSTAIAALVSQAQGRISIMAGGGVQPKNVESLIRLTAVSEVHSACSRSALPCVHFILCYDHGRGHSLQSLRGTLRGMLFNQFSSSASR